MPVLSPESFFLFLYFSYLSNTGGLPRAQDTPFSASLRSLLTKYPDYILWFMLGGSPFLIMDCISVDPDHVRPRELNVARTMASNLIYFDSEIGLKSLLALYIITTGGGVVGLIYLFLMEFWRSLLWVVPVSLLIVFLIHIWLLGKIQQTLEKLANPTLAEDILKKIKEITFTIL